MGFAFFVPRAAAGHGSYIKKGKGKNMIIVLKANRSKEQVKNFISDLTDRYDVSVNTWVGTHSTVLGLIGDTAAVDSEYIAAQDIVESVKRRSRIKKQTVSSIRKIRSSSFLPVR